MHFMRFNSAEKVRHHQGGKVLHDDGRPLSTTGTPQRTSPGVQNLRRSRTAGSGAKEMTAQDTRRYFDEKHAEAKAQRAGTCQPSDESQAIKESIATHAPVSPRFARLIALLCSAEGGGEGGADARDRGRGDGQPQPAQRQGRHTRTAGRGWLERPGR